MITNENMHQIIHSYINNEEVEDRRRSATFLIWFLINVFHTDKDIAISCICDEKNDKGIDGIYIDTIEEEIHIFQSKLKTNYPSAIGDSALRDFEGVKAWFTSSDTVADLLDSTINEELKALIVDNNLIDLVNDYKIKYNFIINAEKDHNTNEYLKVNPNIDLWCLDSIRESYHEIKFDPFVNDTFAFNNISDENTIELNDNNMIITPLLASEIIKLKGIDDLTLFHSNVRFGLGNTRINKSIVKTLKDIDEKDKFIMFHNGISIVCNDYTYENDVLSLTDYSIVNGAQSTLTFYKNQNLLDENVKVMTKIIKTGTDQTLSELITYYSNNQNSISMRDLRSNDTIQRRLITQFETLDEEHETKIDYVPKRGKPVPTGYIELTSDYVAQLITACYLNKPYDTHLKASMFDAKYNTIFSKNITASKVYLYYKMHEILKSELSKIKNQKIATYGLAQFAILNIIFLILEAYDETNPLVNDPDIYFTDMEKYDAFFVKLYDLILKVFNHVIGELEKDDIFIYKNYFKNRENVDDMISKVQSHFETSLSIADTSYSEYYRNIFETSL